MQIADEPEVFTSTGFSILGPLEGTTTVLATLYPASEDGAALAGDVAILQLDVAGSTDDIASVELAGDLILGTEMIDSTDFHDSLKTKWGVAAEAGFLYPIRVGGPSGSFFPTATVEDIAGQIDAATFTVEVIGSRETFNIYLMPELNFITPVLQCASPPSTPILCTGGGDVSFDIARLLSQSVENVNPDFLTEIGETDSTVTFGRRGRPYLLLRYQLGDPGLCGVLFRRQSSQRYPERHDSWNGVYSDDRYGWCFQPVHH